MVPILPLIVLLPFLSIIVMLSVNEKFAHRITLITSVVVLLLALTAVSMFKLGLYTSFYSVYINELNISLGFQLTQITSILVVMTAIVLAAASFVGKYFIRENERTYSIIFAIVESSSLALFMSANLFMLYVFWEICEIAMFFIIFMYGGYDRRYASIKFIVYSLVSSLLLLISIILIYNSVTPHTFNISLLLESAKSISTNMQLLIMLLLLGSFMIKMPIFPLHSWLPDAHTEAPTTGSMILAGILLKFGGYGLLLMFLMLPLATKYSPYIAGIFILSSIYAALVAMRQTNIKRAIAYMSVTDMGIVALGVAASNILGYSGALYGMFSHGIAISILFLIAGTLDELYGTLEINKIKGVMKNFPSLSYLFIFGAIATIGVPITAGFIGDLFVFLGSFKSFGVAGIVSLSSIVLIGAVLFWIVERVFLGSKETEPYRHPWKRIIYAGLFLAASVIVLGIFPFLLLPGQI